MPANKPYHAARLVACCLFLIVGAAIEAAKAGVAAKTGVAPKAGEAAEAEDTTNATCAMDTPFTVIRDRFLVKSGRLASLPATAVLPSDRDGKILFHQALGEGAGLKSFRVFETDTLDIAKAEGEALPVLSVERAPNKQGAAFSPADSVVLDVQITAHNFPLWQRRNFVAVACAGDQLVSWGMFTARVSAPLICNGICAAIAASMYLLAMGAVWQSRRSPHILQAKYPSVFGAKQLTLKDFANPIHLTMDSFGHASVQKFQVILFSFLVGWLVLSLVLETGTLADLSLTVVGLLGISGIGAATAQITYQQKTRLSFPNWAWLARKEVLVPDKNINAMGPRWRDLVLSNREFDVYKLQTIIFSLAVACAMIFAGDSNLESFNVPETLLGVLGLSQVVYVGGILVRPPAVDDLDQALTRLREAGETVAAAKAQNTDTDAAGKLLTGLPSGAAAALNAQRQYDDLADTIIPMIESTLEIKADRTKL